MLTFVKAGHVTRNLIFTFNDFPLTSKTVVTYSKSYRKKKYSAVPRFLNLTFLFCWFIDLDETLTIDSLCTNHWFCSDWLTFDCFIDLVDQKWHLLSMGQHILFQVHAPFKNKKKIRDLEKKYCYWFKFS